MKEYLGILAPIFGGILIAWISTFVRSDAKKSAQAAKDYAEALAAKSSLVDALRESVKDLNRLREEDNEACAAQIKDIQERCAEDDKRHQEKITNLQEQVNEWIETQARQVVIQKSLEAEIKELKASSTVESATTEGSS
jgi:hypothetical protein